MKPLITFIMGALVAAGISYWVVGRRSPASAPPQAGSIASSSVPAAVPAAPAPAAAPAAPPASAPVAVKPAKVPAARKPVIERKPPPAPRVETRPATTESAPAVVETPAPAAQPQKPPEPARPAQPAPQPPAQPPPPPVVEEPMRVTIPANTTISVRLDHSISTERVQTGSVFHASLDQPLSIDGVVLAERGAKAEGRITHAEQAGHVKGGSRLTLELTRLALADGQTITFSTIPITREIEGAARKEATKVAVGAGIGAALGAIFGGGRGAAIGAGSGAAAGAGSVAMTRNKPLVLPSETRLAFHINVPLNVVERR